MQLHLVKFALMYRGDIKPTKLRIFVLKVVLNLCRRKVSAPCFERVLAPTDSVIPLKKQ